MLDCSQFLEGYSAYRDGELDNSGRAEFEAHRTACAACARYDWVIDEGVRLYRRSPELRPSEDFLPRLQHRLYHVEDERRLQRSHASGVQVAVTLAIAATIAAVAWLPAARSSPEPVQLAPIAARAPAPPPPPTTPSVFRSGSVFVPAGVEMPGWNVLPTAPASGELFFRYSPAGSEFRVHSVSQR
jgi:hypothetical protein